MLQNDLLNFIIPLLLPLIFIQGCGGRPVLQTYPADPKEIAAVTEAFLRYRNLSDEICSCCLDAEAETSLSMTGWFRDHTGKFSGYLQAMEPGYIRFVALNPLGQPWYILVTDGKIFKSLNVFEEKAYSGSVLSETYGKYAPAGFKLGFSYYWLTGKLQPGDMQIRAVMHDREQDAFWLQIKHANGAAESMVLFDPVEQLILRHILRDERGKHLADVVYAEYKSINFKESKYSGTDSPDNTASVAAEYFCRVPGRITISPRAGSEKIDVKLHSFIEDVRFSADDFSLEIPDNFEQLFVR